MSIWYHLSVITLVQNLEGLSYPQVASWTPLFIFGWPRIVSVEAGGGKPHSTRDKSFPNHACGPKLVSYLACTCQLMVAHNIPCIFLSVKAHQTLTHDAVYLPIESAMGQFVPTFTHMWACHDQKPYFYMWFLFAYIFPCNSGSLQGNHSWMVISLKQHCWPALMWVKPEKNSSMKDSVYTAS